MKKIIIALALLLPLVSINAQNIASVNTETILNSIPEYVSAQDQLNTLSDKYKAAIEKEVGEIEQLYNTYQQKKLTYPAAQRTAAENEILEREKAVKEKQKIYFGEDGIMALKSNELLLPIKERLDNAIAEAAKAGGYPMVIDLATAQGVVYYGGVTDISDEVLKIYNTLK